MRSGNGRRGVAAAAEPASARAIRCAVYTRKSTEEGLQQEFNSLDAQREAGEAFIAAQKHEGWQVVPEHFDDGGYTGGNMDRPAIQRLLAAVESRAVDCVVVYKVDRLSRSLMDFARIVEVFDRNGVSFVSVTQQFNTTTSLGRLTLNILLSFAQFEREIISERTRDKMSAARRKGKWIGGHPVLGYDIDPKGGRLVVNPEEAERVRTLFSLYLELGSLLPVLQEAQRRGLLTKRWTTEDGKVRGGQRINKGTLHGINNEFQRVLTKLAFLPCGLFLISHAKEMEMDSRTGKYTRVVPTLPDKARKIVLGMADMVLFCDLDVQPGTEGEPSVRRVIRTKPSLYYEAGDRTGRLPETLDLDFSSFLAAFNTATAAKGTARPVASGRPAPVTASNK